MSKTICRVLPIFAVLAGIVMLSSCGVRVIHPHVVQPIQHHVVHYDYVYYPNAQIYFDPRRKLYFYKSGVVWRSVNQLPSNFSVDLSYSVSLKMDTATPYMKHNHHLRRYPAVARRGRPPVVNVQPPVTQVQPGSNERYRDDRHEDEHEHRPGNFFGGNPIPPSPPGNSGNARYPGNGNPGMEHRAGHGRPVPPGRGDNAARDMRRPMPGGRQNAREQHNHGNGPNRGMPNGNGHRPVRAGNGGPQHSPNSQANRGPRNAARPEHGRMAGPGKARRPEHGRMAGPGNARRPEHGRMAGPGNANTNTQRARTANTGRPSRPTAGPSGVHMPNRAQRMGNMANKAKQADGRTAKPARPGNPKASGRSHGPGKSATHTTKPRQNKQRSGGNMPQGGDRKKMVKKGNGKHTVKSAKQTKNSGKGKSKGKNAKGKNKDAEGENDAGDSGGEESPGKRGKGNH